MQETFHGTLEGNNGRIFIKSQSYITLFELIVIYQILSGPVI